jgi:hypothetical protein
VDNTALVEIPFRQFPKFFDPDRKHLRFLAFVQSESCGQLFCKRSARPFAEHCDLCEQVDSGLEILFRFAILPDSLVTGTNSYHGVVVTI